VPLETRRSLGAPAERPDVWAPGELQTSFGDRNQRFYQLLGRLKGGISAAEVQPLVEGVATSIATDYPIAGQRWEPVVITLSDELTGAIRPVLWVFLGAVGLVLLLACANVANLLLARQSSRRREMGIRMALGASRGQLAAQQLSEAGLLAAFGGLAGLAIAFGAIRALRLLEPGVLPRLEAIRVDLPVALFALVAASLAAFLAAAAPVAQIWTAKPDSLRPAAVAHSTNQATRRMRSALVVVQLAVCLTLLVGAALLARSFVNLLRTDVGIATHRAVAVELNLAMGRPLSTAGQIALTKRLLERVRTIPGVTAVGAANALPPNRSRMVVEFSWTDQATSASSLRRLDLVNPTPEYFAALGIPLLAGRFFTDADHASAARVGILSASAARALFGDQDPIGELLPTRKGAPDTVVGVVGDVKYGGLEASARETLYLPFEQYPFRNMTLVARASGDPRFLTTTIERALHEVDREITRGSARTLEEVMSEAAVQPRFRTALLSAIAGLALLLGAVGLYGVVSYAISRRTVEIGVRMALGATDSRVMLMVLKEILALALAGVVLGTVGAVSLTRSIEAYLFEVAPTDTWSFVLAVGALVLVALMATYAPVRRATRISPITALRTD
jgi:putative ABC transport system permease protein